MHWHGGGRAKVEGNTYLEIGKWKKPLANINQTKKKVENSKKPEKTFVKLYSLHRAHFHQIEKCAGILNMTARYLSALLSVALKKLQIDIGTYAVNLFQKMHYIGFENNQCFSKGCQSIKS